MTRSITYAEALREAQDYCLETRPETYLMGLGVPDPKGVFGSTLGLQEKFGNDRVFDTPLSENAMTGVALGTAISGRSRDLRVASPLSRLPCEGC